MACKYIYEGVTYNSKEEFVAKVVQPKYGTLANVDQTLKAKGVSKEDAQKLTVPQNQFLHLLGRDNNWVTFFVKSIIQDTAKQTITEVQESDVEAKVRELEKEGLLEIDCKGKLKAEKGLATSFTKGGKWRIYEIFEGKSHKQGGIDINIKNNQISFTNKNGSIKAKYGLVIPKDN